MKKTKTQPNELETLRARLASMEAQRNGVDRTSTIHTAGVEPATGTWLVTPAVAGAWLARNTHNRPVSPGRVKALAGEISGGRWMLTHQGLAFADSGVLLDGQHRLAAVVEAERPVLMTVVCGLDEAARNVIDTGRRRSASDTLRLEGHSYAALVASILTIENQVQHAESGRAASTALVLEMLAANPDVRDAAVTVSARKGAIAGWIRPSTLGWWYWRAMRVEPEKAAIFLDQVARGEGLHAGSPALAFRTRLSAVARSNARSASRPQTLYLLCSAWSAFCDGRSLAKSQSPHEGNPLLKLYGPGMQ